VSQAEVLEDEPGTTNYIFQPASTDDVLSDKAAHLEVIRQVIICQGMLPAGSIDDSFYQSCYKIHTAHMHAVHLAAACCCICHTSVNLWQCNTKRAMQCMQHCHKYGLDQLSVYTVSLNQSVLLLDP